MASDDDDGDDNDADAASDAASDASASTPKRSKRTPRRKTAAKSGAKGVKSGATAASILSVNVPPQEPHIELQALADLVLGTTKLDPEGTQRAAAGGLALTTTKALKTVVFVALPDVSLQLLKSAPGGAPLVESADISAPLKLPAGRQALQSLMLAPWRDDEPKKPKNPKKKLTGFENAAAALYAIASGAAAGSSANASGAAAGNNADVSGAAGAAKPSSSADANVGAAASANAAAATNSGAAASAGGFASAANGGPAAAVSVMPASNTAPAPAAGAAGAAGSSTTSSAPTQTRESPLSKRSSPERNCLMAPQSADVSHFANLDP